MVGCLIGEGEVSDEYQRVPQPQYRMSHTLTVKRLTSLCNRRRSIVHGLNVPTHPPIDGGLALGVDRLPGVRQEDAQAVHPPQRVAHGTDGGLGLRLPREKDDHAGWLHPDRLVEAGGERGLVGGELGAEEVREAYQAGVGLDDDAFVEEAGASRTRRRRYRLRLSRAPAGRI